MRICCNNGKGRFALLCCFVFASNELLVNGSRFGFSKGYLPPFLQQQRTKQPTECSKTILWSRGGDQEETLTLDEKVQQAMEKLGIEKPSEPQSEEQECKDGVCPMPTPEEAKQEDAHALADRIAKEMNIDASLAMAAVGATSTVESGTRKYNEPMARAMIQQELDAISAIPEDSNEVKQLVNEGYEDTFLVRRALAFADNNMEDARAILLAEKLDQEEEEREAQQQESAAEPQPAMKTVTVDSNFDPATIGAKPTPAKAPVPAAAPGGGGMPSPAKKEDVVFEATTAQIQKLVIESPVPVLLDIHAEWCGPCKVLGPILEDMAVKSGGLFRLVKVNSDNERPVSAALEITALPTVFAIKDGKIVNSFQGMPRSEEMMKSFMMGLLMPGAKFDPPVTAEEEKKYEELSAKLAKTAGAASFSFAAREVLQDRISNKLDALVKAQNGDLVDTEESVQILRSLMSNVIRDPYEMKFRKVNLANKVLATKISKYPPCIAILKSVGFVQEDDDTLVIAKNKRVVNIAPLQCARDYLDKWIAKTRYDVAKAARKRKDEKDLKELAESGALDEEEEEEEEPEEKVDPNQCQLKVRIAGKKKVYEVSLHADSSLSSIIDNVPGLAGEEDEIQITCVAKRLVVKSTDKAAMKKSLRDYKLLPTAAIVVKVGTTEQSDSSPKTSLKERAAAKRQKKTGSHTMQSIGVYSKDDNAKGELIDGGGGSLWEHDVTSDDEPAEDEKEKDSEEEEDEDLEKDS